MGNFVCFSVQLERFAALAPGPDWIFWRAKPESFLQRRTDQVSLQKQPNDQNVADSVEVEVAKGGKAEALDETDQEKGTTGEAGAQQVSEEKAEKAGELSIATLTNMVCVETVNAFHDITNNKDSSTFLHLSQEAQALGIDFQEAFTADGSLFGSTRPRTRLFS